MEPGAFAADLRLARGGDRDVAGRLLARFESALILQARASSRAYLRAKIDAEDVAQEALLLAWQHLDQFRGDTAEEFAAWLRRILASQLARVFRHFQSTRARDLALERPLITPAGHFWAEPAASWTSPSQAAVRVETSAHVERALASLPPHYRLVLIWHERQGMTFAQIGLSLGRSEQAVRKLWSRALLALHDAMASP